MYCPLKATNEALVYHIHNLNGPSSLDGVHEQPYSATAMPQPCESSTVQEKVMDSYIDVIGIWLNWGTVWLFKAISHSDWCWLAESTPARVNHILLRTTAFSREKSAFDSLESNQKEIDSLYMCIPYNYICIYSLNPPPHTRPPFNIPWLAPTLSSPHSIKHQC